MGGGRGGVVESWVVSGKLWLIFKLRIVVGILLSCREEELVLKTDLVC